MRRVSRADSVVVPAIVLGELLAGFRAGSRRERNEEELAEFLAHPAVFPGDVDADAAEHYARLVQALREAGTRVATNDLWVAAVASAQGLVVLTCDADFARIPVASEIVAPG